MEQQLPQAEHKAVLHSFMNELAREINDPHSSIFIAVSRMPSMASQAEAVKRKKEETPEKSAVLFRLPVRKTHFRLVVTVQPISPIPPPFPQLSAVTAPAAAPTAAAGSATGGVNMKSNYYWRLLNAPHASAGAQPQQEVTTTPLLKTPFVRSLFISSC